MKQLLSKLRRLFHRHDRIECWCELTDFTAPPKLPVQGPGAPCPTCWVKPGVEHELSCPEVSPDLFAEFHAWRTR